jgi:hypothetical protein
VRTEPTLTRPPLLTLLTALMATAAAVASALGCGDPKEGTLQGLDVAPREAETNPGQVVEFVGLGDYPEGKGPSGSPPIDWRSSDEAVATVDGQGRATARAPGSATITATSGGFVATAMLVVVPPLRLTALQITSAGGRVPVQRTLALTATGIYSDGSMTRLTDAATWASSDPAIAIVTNEGFKGLAVGKSEGTVDISATIGTVQGKLQLTVTALGSPDP